MSLNLEIDPNNRLIRVDQVLEIIPVCKSGWWEGVKSGRYPAPVKLGPRTTAWRLSDILSIVNGEWEADK